MNECGRSPTIDAHMQSLGSDPCRHPDLVHKDLLNELINFSPLLIHDPVDTVVHLIIGLELEELA